jgi:hypothetical protein
MLIFLLKKVKNNIEFDKNPVVRTYYSYIIEQKNTIYMLCYLISNKVMDQIKKMLTKPELNCGGKNLSLVLINTS